jgi:hypothetical protein
MLADRWQTPEAKSGLAAFFDRGRPSWSPEGQ